MVRVDTARKCSHTGSVAELVSLDSQGIDPLAGPFISGALVIRDCPQEPGLLDLYCVRCRSRRLCTVGAVVGLQPEGSPQSLVDGCSSPLPGLDAVPQIQVICFEQIPLTKTPDSVLFWRLHTLQRTHSCPVHDPPLCSGSQKSISLGFHSPNAINSSQGSAVTKHETQQLVEKEPPVVVSSSEGALGTVGASQSMGLFIYSPLTCIGSFKGPPSNLIQLVQPNKYRHPHGLFSVMENRMLWTF